MNAEGQDGRTSLLELARVFLRLGVTAFGGPAAHVGLMQAEFVERRRWLDEERFLDLFAAANLIPGPNSTEVALHVGWSRRRWSGLLVAGLAFVAPAVLLTGLLAAAYVRYGALPEVRWVFYGIAPVVLAIVAHALWKLVPRAARTNGLRVLGVAALVACAFGAHELAVLFGAGIVAWIARGAVARRDAHALLPLVLPTSAGTALAAAPITLPSIFLVFCKTGAVLFGSGYVLLAYLRADLVERLGWIGERELLDSIAAGQVTPGPLFSTATFLGYVLDGWSGALVATIGIFLPAFVFVAASGPLVPKLRASPAASAFLDGVQVASLALMAVVGFELARGALVDATTIGIGVASLVLLTRTRVNPTWLVVGGAAVSVSAHLVAR